jgi:hypothetical protein
MKTKTYPITTTSDTAEGTNARSDKAPGMEATERTNQEPLDPREAAASAVAALIRSGEDAQSLFDVLRRFGADLGGSQPALVELGSLLNAWESHLPAGHRSADSPFWSDVAAACRDVSMELEELGSVECGSAQVLLGATEKAALAHLQEAQR